MQILFGRDFILNYSLQLQGKALSLPTSGLISARIYDTIPNAEQRANTGTGHLQEVTTWVSGALLDNSMDISFSGLTDPAPTSSDDYERYYIALIFYQQMDNLVPSQSVETIHVYRPDGLLSRISVTPADLKKSENKLTSLLTDAQLSNHIQFATDNVLEDLYSTGIRSTRIYDPNKLSSVVRLTAISYACLDLASEDESVWILKHRTYADRAKRVMDVMQIPYDRANDNDPGKDELANYGKSIGVIYTDR